MSEGYVFFVMKCLGVEHREIFGVVVEYNLCNVSQSKNEGKSSSTDKFRGDLKVLSSC